ncbi:Thioesterase domain-containing protein [Cupriavidus sp. H19C3]|uniref:PaaI family thioesterase n=1 Tax=Cupriavidus sp. H19C3 TaxID=3241603 RepID=UPI0011DA56E1|nr:MAG: PaaI family thioesterase [Cupriavidus sp.]
MDKAAATVAFERALARHQPAFGQFFLAQLLGLEFDYTDDRCIVSFELKDFLFNPQGSLHGGIVATVMDISMGHLLRRCQGPGATLEMKTQYLKAVRQGRMTCTGQFIRQGHGISFLQSTLVDDTGDIVAYATSTWKRLKTP